MAHGIARTITDSMIVTKRNLIRMRRLPEAIFFNSVQPVMFVLLFRYVFGGAITTGGEYVNFLIPGILVQTTLFGGAGTAIGLNEDMGKGIIDVFSLVVIAGIIAVLALHPTIVSSFFSGSSTLLGTALKG
jgi:Fe2+ transport system protein B